MSKKEDIPVSTPVTVEGPSQSLAVRREPVPKELEALGVKVAVDPTSDMQILIIPKELREKANVLTPVQAFQQADPNWRPSLRVVELDPSANGAHFYDQQGKLAPRKQALELLADAAGVVSVSTKIFGRERVEVGDMMAETFTHIAVLKIRKSDGTLRTLEASRTYEPFAEYEELKASAKGEAVLRKRWINEIKFAKAKNESKAVNRAMRAAIQVPHTFTAADAAKPFVVVGWNLAPQSTEAVQAAIAQLYGAAPETDETFIPSQHDWDPPELAEGEVVPEDDSGQYGDPEPNQQTAGAGADPLPTPASAGTQDSSDAPVKTAQKREAGPATSRSAPADPAAESDDAPGDAPSPTEDPPAPSPVDAEMLTVALKATWPIGGYQGKTLAWTLEQGESANEWISWALDQPWPHDVAFKAALVLVAQAYLPDMYATWAEAQS